MDAARYPGDAGVSTDAGTVARRARVVGAATLASRILGLLRDFVLAYAFGAGRSTDAFFIAFTIPNLFRRLVGEGARAFARGVDAETGANRRVSGERGVPLRGGERAV